MEYKLLESNGVEIENIDGAALNNFFCGNKSGIISNVLTNCTAYAVNNLNLQISTGLMIIKGFRIKITSPYSVKISPSASEIEYHVIGRIKLDIDRNVTFEIECRTIADLVQDDNLFMSEQGTYEVEIARFTTNSSGISRVTASLNVMSTPFDEVYERLNTVELSLTDLKHDISESIDTLYKINRGGFE